MLAYITLTLMLVLLQAMAKCPNQCNCVLEEKIDCSYNSMKALPIGNWKLVNLSHNAMHSVTRRIFCVGSVEIIDVSHNAIRNIDRFAFFRYSNVREIDISWNNISFVYPETFLFAQKLEGLSLSHNKLLSLQNNLMFSGHSLRILDISYCNISRIEETTFKYGVSSLQELYLQYNAITYISHNSFSSLTSLKILNIAYNKLYCFPRMEMFVPIKGLTELILGNNPFPCNCHLNNSYTWFLSNKRKLENMSSEISEKNCQIVWAKFSDIVKCSSNYETQTIRALEDRECDGGCDVEDSGGLPVAVTIAIVLAAVVMVIIVCACMLSKSHDCLGAIGCVLICNECLH
jgi:hypothetical protein